MVVPERMSAVLLTGIGGLEQLDFREDVPRSDGCGPR